ncbi:MAG TPA: hypothetical protein VFT43_12445 [Candidatus Polarisedimenticolia bacterium]|nr:hypothetical protein [Candidatus Polarisedimenticolia bacterium]
MEDKVVAHFKNGKTQRGYTQDFRPDAETFHLLPSEGGGIPSKVRLEDLKALFYVKDYGSMRRQVDRAKRFPGAPPSGQKTIVEFKDGEKIWGFAEEYAADSRGFYFIPADPQENNTRVFIVNSSVKQIQFQD